MLRVPAKSIYSKLMYQGQWYVGDITGSPVLPKGVKSTIHYNLHKQYLIERDIFRTKRGDLPIWEHDSSMFHAATVYGVRSSSPNTISSRIRTIFDKGHHGGNRAKNETLSPEQRDETRRCLLCRQPESLDA